MGGPQMHLGPRSAGNKSLLSYRAGHGITGYGGYCPSSESIPVPVKEGPSAMGEQGIHRERGQPPPITGEEVLGRESTYLATINKSTLAKPGCAPPGTKFLVQSVLEDAPPVPSQPFLGASLYQSSYVSPTRKDPMPFATSPFRRKPAYLAGSTYSGTFGNSMEMVHGQAWLENKPPKLVQTTFGTQWKEVVVHPEPDNFRSNYSYDFGTFGDGQAGRSLLDPRQQNQNATTAHMFAGSPKGFNRVPGYQGFLPTEKGGLVNADRIMRQSLDHDRPNPKDCRLFTLQQFPTAVPEAGLSRKYRPVDPYNIAQSGKGKTGTTTYFANHYLSSPENLALIAKKRAETKQFGSSMETKKFFTLGSLQQSENGLENAERFYRVVRPFEALPRIQPASIVTESGYKFSTYTSKV